MLCWLGFKSKRFKHDMNSNDIIRKCEWMLANRCAPKIVSELKENEVFVFGSKPNGHHKSGAAKLAVERYGAVEGKGEGLFGQSYAIPVHKNKTHKMDEAVKTFIGFAKQNPSKRFVVLPVGCGTAGMEVRQVAEMFSSAINVDNIMLPEQFIFAMIDNRRRGNVIQFTDYPNFYILRNSWINKLNYLVNEYAETSVKMDCSIEEAVELIIDMCLPLLKAYYPELQLRTSSVKETFWISPDMADVSLAINQITEGWYQCLRYRLSYDWYCPSLRKEDIIGCLTYDLHLYGPYFDEFDY